MERLVRGIDPFVGDGNTSSFPNSRRNYDDQPRRQVLCRNMITLGEKYIVDKERLGGGKNSAKFPDNMYDMLQTCNLVFTVCPLTKDDIDMSETALLGHMKDKVSPYYADFTNVLFETGNSAIMHLKNSGTKLTTTSPMLDYVFTSLVKDNDMYMDIDENLAIQGPVRKFTQILRPTGLAAFDRNEELTVDYNNTIATMVVNRGVFEDGFRIPSNRLFNANQLKKTDCDLYLVLAPYPESVSPPNVSVPKCNRITSLRSRSDTLNCQDSCRLRYIKSEERDVIDCSYVASFWLVDVNHRSEHLYNMVTQQCIFAGPRHMYTRQAREIAYIRLGRVDKLVTVDTKIPKYKCSGRDVYELKPFLFNPDSEWDSRIYYIPSATTDVGGSVVLDPAKLLRSGTKPGCDSNSGGDDSDDSSYYGGGRSSSSSKKRKKKSSAIGGGATSASERHRFTGGGMSGYRSTPPSGPLSAPAMSSLSSTSSFTPPLSRTTGTRFGSGTGFGTSIGGFGSSSVGGVGVGDGGGGGGGGGGGVRGYGSGPSASSKSVFGGFGEKLISIVDKPSTPSSGTKTTTVVKESPITQRQYGIITSTDFIPASAIMTSEQLEDSGRKHLQRRNEFLHNVVEKYNHALENNNARLKLQIADKNDALRREMKRMTDDTLNEVAIEDISAIEKLDGIRDELQKKVISIQEKHIDNYEILNTNDKKAVLEQLNKMKKIILKEANDVSTYTRKMAQMESKGRNLEANHRNEEVSEMRSKIHILYDDHHSRMRLYEDNFSADYSQLMDVTHDTERAIHATSDQFNDELQKLLNNYDVMYDKTLYDYLENKREIEMREGERVGKKREEEYIKQMEWEEANNRRSSKTVKTRTAGIAAVASGPSSVGGSFDVISESDVEEQSEEEGRGRGERSPSPPPREYSVTVGVTAATETSPEAATETKEAEPESIEIGSPSPTDDETPEKKETFSLKNKEKEKKGSSSKKRNSSRSNKGNAKFRDSMMMDDQED